MALRFSLKVLCLVAVIQVFGACHPAKKQTPSTTTPQTPPPAAAKTTQAPIPESQPTGAPAPIIDPRADQILKQMSAYLQGQSQFSFHGEISQDDPLPTGQIIKFEAVNDIAVHRPDRVFSQYRGDNAKKSFWLDGTTMTLLDQESNIFAKVQVPPTLDGAMDYVMQNFGFAPPLSDLLYTDPHSVLTRNVLVALYIGMSEVDEIPCHHLAMVGKFVDWQIWIEDGKMSVPRKIVINYKTLPGDPQFSAVLSDWDFSTPLAEALFIPQIPSDSTQTDFLPLAGKK
jgi:hypothetical protein